MQAPTYRQINGYASLAERLAAPVPESALPRRRPDLYAPTPAPQPAPTPAPAPAKHKGADCLAPATPKAPGDHPFCVDPACTCTCHARIARQTRAAAAGIRNGHYTVGDDKGRHTVRVADAAWAVERAIPGVTDTTQTVAYLNGPSNESDYQMFGWLDGTRFRPTGRFRGNAELARVVLALLAGPEAAGKTYALESGNCYVCNRLLTTPESIEAGIGPVCAAKE